VRREGLGYPKSEGGRRQECGKRRFDMIFGLIHRLKQAERSQGEVR